MVFCKVCAEMGLVPIWSVEKVIFNDPATVVYWNDGTRTVVKCQPEDTFDCEKGFLLACCKKMFGNTGRYNNILAEYVPEDNSKDDIDVERMRQVLAENCYKTPKCDGCKLNADEFVCGRGKFFTRKPHESGYMSDDLILEHYNALMFEDKCPCDYGICDECNQSDQGNSQGPYKSARGYFDRCFKKEGNNE